MPAAENGSMHAEKEVDRAPIINGMETLPKTKQVFRSKLLRIWWWVAHRPV